MRKSILIIALFLSFSYFASAQDMARTGGTYAVELTMTPFTENEAWISPGYIKGRYFFPEFGVRLGLGTNMLFQGIQEDRPEEVRNFSFIDLRPGAEYYLYSAGEAKAYAGVDFVFAMQRTNFDTSVGAPISGAWDVDPEILRNRGFTAFGFNLVAGGDYHLKGGGLYVGAEVGFEYLYFKNHEVTWGDQVVVRETNSSQFRPTLLSILRIGIAF